MQDKYITFLVIYMDAETPSVYECWLGLSGGGSKTGERGLTFLHSDFKTDGRPAFMGLHSIRRGIWRVKACFCQPR